MVAETVKVGCIPMATPFDEESVDLCIEFDMPIIKIASSDINDWSLIERIGSARRPVIASTGGASEKDWTIWSLLREPGHPPRDQSLRVAVPF